MKKMFTIFILLVISTLLISCDIDLSDTSHDNDFIRISTYFEIDEQSGDVLRLYYIEKIDNNIKFYTFDESTL